MITFDTGVTVKELRARLKRKRGNQRILLSVEVWPEALAKRPAKKRGKKREAEAAEPLPAIVQAIQAAGVRLRRRGRKGSTWKGRCPFHTEKTPSFNVNGEKGFFKCFGCGVGGDVVKFQALFKER